MSDRTDLPVDAVNPAHYRRLPKDVIDIIRDTLGDDGFASYCLGNALKYRLRAGEKGDATEDIKKAQWYEAMYAHVTGIGPDPRTP